MAFPFRSQSVGALVEAIAEGFTGARMGTLFLKAGAEEWAPERFDNKEHRVQLIFKALRKTEDPAADQAALEIARMTLEAGSPRTLAGNRKIVWWEPLRDALAADGWEYDVDSARLTSIIPEIAVAQELNGLEAELEKLGWSTSALHFRRAAKGFGSGDWESANSQLRSFLEDFLPSLCEALTGKRPANEGAAIQALDQELLGNGERELLKGLRAICNERGSHPGESNRVEATFRLATVTTLARFLLSRLED